MPQTSIGTPAIAFAGQRSDLDPAAVISAAAEGAGIVAGQPVLRGTDKQQQAIAITNGATLNDATLLGWVCHNPYAAADLTGDGATIVATDALDIMRKGVMYVQVTAAVVAGNPVYVGTATAQLGDIDDATGTGLTIVPGARFRTSAGVDGFARIEINLP